MTACNCGARWTGQRIEHCCSCHNTFKGTTAGDRHRVGNHAIHAGPDRRRCLTADEMLAKGMSYTENAHGTRMWSTGRGDNPWSTPKSLARPESDGLADYDWGNVPLVIFSGVTETDGVA